eukprot:scaffold23690_cov32-Tisochrysis_lutea.AAC.1
MSGRSCSKKLVTIPACACSTATRSASGESPISPGPAAARSAWRMATYLLQQAAAPPSAPIARSTSALRSHSPLWLVRRISESRRSSCCRGSSSESSASICANGGRRASGGCVEICVRAAASVVGLRRRSRRAGASRGGARESETEEGDSGGGAERMWGGRWRGNPRQREGEPVEGGGTANDSPLSASLSFRPLSFSV